MHTHSVQAQITNTRIDLITHSNTQVPYFYKGKPLPSSGNEVTVTALVFKETKQPSDAYTYRWSINGKTFNGEGTSGNRITFESRFEKEIIASVSVLTKSGTLVGTQSIRVPIVKPEAYFYLSNPLRGFAPNTLADPYTFVGDEMTLHTELFYVDADAEDLVVEWKIDGKSIENTSGSPLDLNLQKNKSSGSSKITFVLKNTAEFLQQVESQIRIKY